MGTIRMRWNFKFWRPVACIGGRIFIGYYYETIDADGEVRLQTPSQFAIKADMGCYRGYQW